MKSEHAVQFAIEAAKRVQKDCAWKEMTEEEFLTALSGELKKLIEKYDRG